MAARVLLLSIFPRSFVIYFCAEKEEEEERKKKSSKKTIQPETAIIT